jgi:glycosyltransferase involved in cell wall biosynthesis
MTAYNHEKYVAAAVESVFRQTFKDWELVVVDDGSTDNTSAVLTRFADPRVIHIRQENQGPGAAANRAIAACRGRFLAFMSGDDVSHADRLEVQLREWHRAGGGALFSNVEYIDDDGFPIESSHFPKDFFLLPPMSRGQLLERFFDHCNFIHPVTFFAEADLYRQSGGFDPLLYQLQDYDWLVRLVKRSHFTVLRSSLVSVRACANQANLSAPHPGRSIRCTTEYYLILRRFFEEISPDLFRQAFGPRLRLGNAVSPIELACEQAFLYIHHPQFPLARLIGLEKLYSLLQQPEAASVLHRDFDFSPQAFADLLQRVDVLNLASAR